MHQIFKLKRKIFYLINMAFYLIFFIMGYFVGGGNFEKIKDIIPNIFG